MNISTDSLPINLSINSTNSSEIISNKLSDEFSVYPLIFKINYNKEEMTRKTLSESFPKYF